MATEKDIVDNKTVIPALLPEGQGVTPVFLYDRKGFFL